MSYQEHTTLMAVANRLAIGDLTARYVHARQECRFLTLRAGSNGDGALEVEAWAGIATC
jgi:hypothetical protein